MSLLSVSLMRPLDLSYDLKTPCADCPFRKDVPCHEGIATGIVDLFHAMEMGRGMHSCHKTDPRADGYNPAYKGPVQHCAGFMIMQLNGNDEPQRPVRAAIDAGKLDATRLNMDAPVFKNILAMSRHYAAWATKLLRDREIARAVAAAENEGMRVC